MSLILNGIAGLFIMLAASFIKFPVAALLIIGTKTISDRSPNAFSFGIGVGQDTFGYVCAVWIANYTLLRLANVGLSWILLIVLCLLVPWLSWERMMNAGSESIHWFEIGCNTGRIVGLVLGGLLFI